jgi:hypothetical protein
MMVIITASTKPITPTDEVGMDEAIAAITDVKDHKTITKALAIKEALATKGGSHRGSSGGKFWNGARYQQGKQLNWYSHIGNPQKEELPVSGLYHVVVI